MKVPSVITDTLKGLVSRRLWPVAALLIAALVAVPFVLSRSAEPVAPATPATGTGTNGASETLVALSGSEGGRRRVLGSAKDPFQPAPTPTPKKKSSKQAKAASEDATGSTTPTTSGGADTTGTGTGTGTGTTAPATTGGGSGSTGSGTRTASNSISVRFGSADGDSLGSEVLAPLEALPNQDAPIAIYLGLENHGKTAVFMLGDGVTVDGDGACDPSPTRCDKVRLKAGETEFLTVAGSQTLADGEYQLDVVKVHK